MVAQRDSEQRGDEQDVDQRALELAREDAPQRLGRRLGQRVRTVRGLALRDLGGVQAPRRIDLAGLSSSRTQKKAANTRGLL